MVSCFPQASLSLPAGTATNSVFVLKSLAVDFALLTVNYLLEQPSQRLPDDRQGLKLGLKLELCRLTNKL